MPAADDDTHSTAAVSTRTARGAANADAAVTLTRRVVAHVVQGRGGRVHSAAHVHGLVVQHVRARDGTSGARRRQRRPRLRRVALERRDRREVRELRRRRRRRHEVTSKAAHTTRRSAQRQGRRGERRSARVVATARHEDGARRARRGSPRVTALTRGSTARVCVQRHSVARRARRQRRQSAQRCGTPGKHKQRTRHLHSLAREVAAPAGALVRGTQTTCRTNMSAPHAHAGASAPWPRTNGRKVTGSVPTVDSNSASLDEPRQRRWHPAATHTHNNTTQTSACAAQRRRNGSGARGSSGRSNA